MYLNKETGEYENDFFEVNLERGLVKSDEIARYPHVYFQDHLVFPKLSFGDGEWNIRLNEEYYFPVRYRADTDGYDIQCDAVRKLEAGKYDGELVIWDTKKYNIDGIFPVLLSSRELNIEVVFFNEFEGVVVSEFGVEHNFLDIDDEFYSCFDVTYWQQLRLPKRTKR